MKKLTQRQAAAIVEDPANWKTIEVTHFFRTSRLDYSGMSWIRIEHRVIKNITEMMLKRDTQPVTGFGLPEFFEYDQEHDCLGYSVRPTNIANKIWKEGTPDAEAPQP